MKQKIIDNIKNVIGTKTNSKYVVFAIDDYGNIRTHSKAALQQMQKKGLKPHSRFDSYDHLETKTDLEALYDVLTSVKDVNGNNAVFSPLALSGNINFEAMESNDYSTYVYENLIQSFSKLSVILPKQYQGAWDLWKLGLAEGIMQPEFHGREHLNLRSFNHKLEAKDVEVLTALKNRSYSCISDSGFPNISSTAAFEFENIEENEYFKSVILQGLHDFEKVYGYTSSVFNAPGGREHPLIHKYLKEGGIQFIETPWIKNEHQGKSNYKRKINYSGQNNKLGLTYSVRNVVFEPTHNRGFDWVSYSLKQIETAFRWNRPAVISSHRVNFCGMIDEKNRKNGLASLKRLLHEITLHYPEVEFIGLGKMCKRLYS